jgi:hypothetical protein
MKNKRSPFYPAQPEQPASLNVSVLKYPHAALTSLLFFYGDIYDSGIPLAV